jgi:hypothetical protein
MRHKPPRIVTHVLTQIEHALATAHAKTQLRGVARRVPTTLDGLDIVPLAAPAKDFGEIAKPLFLDFDRVLHARTAAAE